MSLVNALSMFSQITKLEISHWEKWASSNKAIYIHSDDVGFQAHKDANEDEEDTEFPDLINVAGPSHLLEEFSMESLSRQMTEMARMQNEMMNFQNARHEEICTHLKHIDERISGLEKHF